MLKFAKPLPSSHPLNKIRHTLQHGDIPWQAIIIAASILVMVLMLGIGLQLWNESADARLHNGGLSFLMPTADPSWDPVNDVYQAWPFIYGTLLTSVVAILLAIPISLGIAVFLAELCPGWLRTPLNWLVELLAAIPSVVYGLWGLFVFLPVVVVPVGVFLGDVLGNVPALSIFFAGPISQSGASLLGAAMILTIMVIPTIAAVSRDVLTAIPPAQREASLALGSTEWETIWQVLLPYGLSGILGAVILGLGRALGETMAVTMVIGNSAAGSISILRPGYTMASIIANEFAEAVSALHAQSLIEVGFVLFVLTLLLNILARFLVWRVARKTPQEGARMTSFREVIARQHALLSPRRKATNILMLSMTGVFTLLALVPLFWIIGYVIYKGGTSLNLDFFTQLPRPLGTEGGGVVHAIEGTIIVTLLAAVFAVPPGVLAAFYAAQHPNTALGVAVRFSTDVLAGVPSIVTGLFVYAVMVKPMGHFSGLAGGVALAILMLPTIIRTTEEMLKLVPHALHEGSLALGAPEWKTSLDVMLPAAFSGIATGLLLGIARASGETAPLLFTALGNERFSLSQIVTSGLQSHQSIFQIFGRIIDQPIDSLPLTLWKYAQQPYPERVQQAWTVALVLMILVLLLNIIARLWIESRARQLRG